MSRIINDEDYRTALNNEDYQKIIGSATRKFVGILDKEEIKSCQMVGLWKSLQSFSSNHKTKFTSYLYNVTRNECRKLARRSKFLTNINFDKIDTTNYSFELYNIIESISIHKELVVDYFLNGMTLKEIGGKFDISSETVRRRLKKAIKPFLSV